MGLNDCRPGQASSYLDHLPAVFREGGDPFLGRFLLAFEHLLTGVGDPAEPGLDELIDRVPDYLDPERTPTGFLDWLAGWVGLTLRGDLDVDAAVEDTDDAARKRRSLARSLVASAVPLYRLRGTRRGVEDLLRLFSGGLSPSITERTTSFQIGVSSTIGADAQLGGGAPHVFHALLRLPRPNPEVRRRFEALARAVLDLEKPAHTRYHLDVLTPAMQIGVYSQIGVDTLLVPAAKPGDL
ncbi:MAG TPA: phage tail protein [Longimicrobiaceae bacterium]|nr:phage tail protein [Longimicrobiaceae bacterium]